MRGLGGVERRHPTGMGKGLCILTWASCAWEVLEGAKARLLELFELCHHDLLLRPTPTTLPPFQEELPHFPVPTVAKRGSWVLNGASAPSGSS